MCRVTWRVEGREVRAGKRRGSIQFKCTKGQYVQPYRVVLVDGEELTSGLDHPYYLDRTACGLASFIIGDDLQ